MTHIAVLGGGLQGSCIALELARRGLHVTLFDRNQSLLRRTAVANEGKIHLGYMYAGDATFLTAKTMMAGAFAFAPFFERHLDRPAGTFALSQPAIYVVHRDTQHGAAAVSAYLHSVHELIVDYAAKGRRTYFGRRLESRLRTWSRAEVESVFDAQIALAAFDSPEVAIDSTRLADDVRRAIAAHPRIEIRCARDVRRVECQEHNVHVVTDGPDGLARDPFDQVVNATWDGRLAIDQTAGLLPQRAWLHRLKYGISFRLPRIEPAPPSTTFVSGPFGEIVRYADGLTYLTWYPDCMQAISTDIAPPDWPTFPAEPLRTRILAGTLKALAQIVPSLGALDPAALPEACVKGGVIVAWGETDICDPHSGLHRRHEIGVTSISRYHSVDPGKLTMAPYFAERCAERISPDK